MKVTQLWVYPIKALRGIRLQTADLTQQGIRHDRTFMLCKVQEDGSLNKMQLSSHPACALFAQDLLIEEGTIRVRYCAPDEPLAPAHPAQETTLDVPLRPDIGALEVADVNVHQSMVLAYRMGAQCDEWFSACFGFPVTLVYIGDGRRPVLGTFSPKDAAKAKGQQKGWLSSLSSYVVGSGDKDEEPDWLTFTDCAPFLIATEASLGNVRARLPGDSLASRVEMYKFRPNIVLDGSTQWAEDFWSELSLSPANPTTTNGDDSGYSDEESAPAFALSKMCGRCTSLNVDYDTGRPAKGDSGAVLKKLMSDRRVDPGSKYSPVFGRYAFLAPGRTGLRLTLGDEVEVSGTAEERPTWDWDLKDPGAKRYYGQAA